MAFSISIGFSGKLFKGPTSILLVLPRISDHRMDVFTSVGLVRIMTPRPDFLANDCVGDTGEVFLVRAQPPASLLCLGRSLGELYGTSKYCVVIKLSTLSL